MLLLILTLINYVNGLDNFIINVIYFEHQVCVGALVSDTFSLAPCSCVVHRNYDDDEEDKIMVKSTTHFLLKTKIVDQVRTVKDFYIHPNCRLNHWKLYENDFALISAWKKFNLSDEIGVVTTSKLLYSPEIKVAYLEAIKENPFYTCSIGAFNPIMIMFSGFNQTVEVLNLRIIDNSECNRLLCTSPSRHLCNAAINPNSFICALPNEIVIHTYSCKIEKGAILMCLKQLFGLFTDSICKSGSPLIFSNVIGYHKFYLKLINLARKNVPSISNLLIFTYLISNH